MKQIGVLAAVLVISACGVVTNPTSPTDTATSTVMIYSAVGASDANGVGGSVPCLPYVTCPEGTGYVQVIARRYTAAGKTVTLQNLGVPGAALSKTFQDIGNQVNRGIAVNFLNDEVPFIKTDATLVTVFAGGNDANAVASAAKAGLGGADTNAWIAAQIQAFGRDMALLVTGIKTRAPKARVIILNLPNLAAMPYSSSSSLADKRALQAIAVGMNTQINATVGQGATVIDMMCDGRLYNPSIFSSDGFHPNDTGYALFADLVVAAITQTAATAPKSTCSFMSAY